MEFKIDNWEITRNSQYSIRKAFNGDNNTYLCRGPLDKVLYDKIKWYDEFKDYNLPLLPVVETLSYKNDLFIIYKEATPLKSLETFSSEKIIRFIIKMAKFHYETGYCVITNCSDNLFILNGEIHFNPFKIVEKQFDEKTYLYIVYTIFDDFINKICEKIRPIIKQTSYENRDFENVKKTLLSL